MTDHSGLGTAWLDSTPFRCPARGRVASNDPRHRLDRWVRGDGPHRCSGCQSLHPAFFAQLCEAAADPFFRLTWLEVIDGPAQSYVIYRPCGGEDVDALMGSGLERLSFLPWHLPEGRQYPDLAQTFGLALHQSLSKRMAFLQHLADGDVEFGRAWPWPIDAGYLHSVRFQLVAMRLCDDQAH